MRAMVNRFIKCIEEIKKALKDFDITFELTEEEVQDLKDVNNALEPFEVAVKALCRRDATLVTAEKTIEFTIGVLKTMENNISQQLLEVKVLIVWYVLGSSTYHEPLKFNLNFVVCTSL